MISIMSQNVWVLLLCLPVTGKKNLDSYPSLCLPDGADDDAGNWQPVRRDPRKKPLRNVFAGKSVIGHSVVAIVTEG